MSKFYFVIAKLVLVGTDQEEELRSDSQEQEDIYGA
jgi:hypothetical protein